MYGFRIPRSRARAGRLYLVDSEFGFACMELAVPPVEANPTVSDLITIMQRRNWE